MLMVLPPARISHGPETFRAIPGCELVVVGDREHAVADRSIVLRPRRVPVVGRSKHWTAALAWLRGLDRLDPGPVDLVVSFELFSVASAQAFALARRLGVPHVVRVTENLIGKPPYVLPPWRQIAHRTARHSDAFVCVTAGAQAVAEQLGCDRRRTAVVYHGIDIDRFSPAPEGLAPEPLVSFVGELRKLKGVLDLIAAFDRVVEVNPDARLQIIGAGPLRAEIDALAATRPWIRVAGPCDRSEVPAILRGSRAVAVPSRTGKTLLPGVGERWVEQFGFALAEAMASGLPVVTTRCGAIPEVVPAWNPIVAEGDTAGLADAILRVLGPDGDVVGVRNRPFVVDRYDIRKQGVKMGDAIGRLLAGGRDLG